MHCGVFDSMDRRRPMKRAVLPVVAVLATAGSAGAAAPTFAVAAAPSYVTIQFGRAIEGSYTNPGCVPVPGILRLDTAVADLDSLHLTAIGAVNVDRASTSD